MCLLHIECILFVKKIPKYQRSIRNRESHRVQFTLNDYYILGIFSSRVSCSSAVTFTTVTVYKPITSQPHMLERDPDPEFGKISCISKQDQSFYDILLR